MNTDLGLILSVVVALLVLAGILGVLLALGPSKLIPRPPAPKPEEAPAEPVGEQVLAGRKAAYRQGLYVLIGLAVLTAVEFAVAALLEGSVVFLFVLALAKAGAILQYYMHVNKVWSEEEAH